MNNELKEFAKNNFPDSKSDLFSMFMQHAFFLLKENGFNAQINMQSWMFLTSFESLRRWLLENVTLITMAHLGARAFGQISGEVVKTCTYVFLKKEHLSFNASYQDLKDGNESLKHEKLKNEHIYHI
ncbi:restriction enzyme, methylase subunit [Salmonella enterica subsp. enterica serovar Madelia]|nr:restriction enzyme, methylase subunit [Salmonella enterica subsp. enterica serovar Madelia]